MIPGAWIDNSPPVVATEKFWKDFTAIGLRLGAVMIDTSVPKWDPIYTPARFKTVCQMAIARDGMISAVTWPIPQKAMIDAMAADLAKNYLKSGVVGIECDLEHLWKASMLGPEFGPDFKKLLAEKCPPHVIDQMEREFPKPGDGLERAGIYLVYVLGKLARDHDVWTAITTHTGHREMTTRAIVSPRLNYLNGQFYSNTKNWRGEPMAFDGLTGPGRRQELGIAQALRIPGMTVPKLGIGLPAWDQKWPGRSVFRAVAGAYLAALRADPTLKADPAWILYWSTKWFVAGKFATSANSVAVRSAIGWLLATSASSKTKAEAIRKIEDRLSDPHL